MQAQQKQFAIQKKQAYSVVTGWSRYCETGLFAFPRHF